MRANDDRTESERAVPDESSPPVTIPDEACAATRILLIEDEPSDAHCAFEMLTRNAELNCVVTHVDRLHDAIDRIDVEAFDAVLLDLGLPDSQGLDGLDLLRQMNNALPIVVYSGIQSERIAMSAVRHGAQDYVVKGRGSADTLARAIRFAIERKQSEVRISRLAYHDGLTGLPNRRLLTDRMMQGLALARRGGSRLAVVFLDLDNFKWVNDTLGHAAGDELLCLAAERLTICRRDSDTVARYGGDEFTLVLPDITRLSDVGGIADKVLEAFGSPFMIGGQELCASVSMGISVYPEDGVDVATLLRNADAAMYRAKRHGYSSCGFHSPSMVVSSTERLAMGIAVREAVERHEFVLNYQPVTDLATGRDVGMEALLRWERPGLGTVLPAEFLPMVVRQGLMGSVGEWVLRNACSQVADWRAVGLAPRRLAVNVAGQQIDQGDIAPITQHALGVSGWPSSLLDLEISENAAPRASGSGLSGLQELRGLGVRLAMDDFGTGYASLGALRQFPLDVLKIDRSFIRDIVTCRGDATIVRATIDMAHGLGMTVVAEGVETREQASMLSAFGCDQAQGFFFSPPLSAVGMAARLYDQSQ